MHNGLRIILWLSLAILLAASAAFPQEDRDGCKDHPLFSRMPGYYIEKCKFLEFAKDEVRDPDAGGKIKVPVEGKWFRFVYLAKDSIKDRHPSPLQLHRNYANAIEKIGGKTHFTGDYTHFKLNKDSFEIWGYLVCTNSGKRIELTIIEKGKMKQEVTANAKFMAQDIQLTGHVAVYEIYFDFNKAEIKPESEPALKEISKLLQQDAKLKLYVVGHTDGVGGLDYNMKLSQARAEAVVKELVSKYNIAPDRLKAGGVGPLAPVSSNDTEEGRTKNRRVELVKQ